MTPLFLGRLILVLLINKIFCHTHNSEYFRNNNKKKKLRTQNTEIVECGPTQAKQKIERLDLFLTCINSRMIYHTQTH